MIRSVVFDVGETLIDETRIFGRWADRLGVPRLAFFGTLGGVLAEGRPMLDAFRLVKPDFDLEAELEAWQRDEPHSLRENFDEYLGTAVIEPEPGNPDVAFYLRNGPPPIRFNIAPDGSAPFIGTNYSGRNASYFDPAMRMPYVMNWNGSLQWEFASNMLLDLSYQGSGGVGLLNRWDINAIPLDISRDPVQLENIRRASQNFIRRVIATHRVERDPAIRTTSVRHEGRLEGVLDRDDFAAFVIPAFRAHAVRKLCFVALRARGQ